MPSAINKQKTRTAAVAKAAIDTLMSGLNNQDRVSFDEIREGLSRPGLTDGQIHQALLDAGYEVDA